MSWPQIIVMLVLVVATMRDLVYIVREGTTETSVAGAATFMFVLAWRVGIAFALAAGGFW